MDSSTERELRKELPLLVKAEIMDEIKPFGSFGTTEVLSASAAASAVDVQPKVRKHRIEQFVWEVGDKPKLPTVKRWEPHLKSHGDIYYDGTGQFCTKLECEINHNPRSLLPIFDAIDRKEY